VGVSRYGNSVGTETIVGNSVGSGDCVAVETHVMLTQNEGSESYRNVRKK